MTDLSVFFDLLFAPFKGSPELACTPAADDQPLSMLYVEDCMSLVRDTLDPGPSTSAGPSRPVDRRRLRGRLNRLTRLEQRRRCRRDQGTPAASAAGAAASGGVVAHDPGAEMVYDSSVRQRQWAEFVRHARAADNMSESDLMEYLDRGIVSFSRLFPGLYEMLWRRFPAVYIAVHISATTGVSFRSCTRDPRGPGPSHMMKRSDGVHAREPGTVAASGGDKCSGLLDMGKLKPSVYVCNDINFGPPCVWIDAPPGQCGTY